MKIEIGKQYKVIKEFHDAGTVVPHIDSVIEITGINENHYFYKIIQGEPVEEDTDFYEGSDFYEEGLEEYESVENYSIF